MPPLPRDDSGSLVAVLRDDWGLNRLLQALALGEGFQFHLLISDTPRVAQAAFRLIQESLDESLLVMEPDRKKRAASKPLRFHDLVPVLSQLMELLREFKGKSRVLVIDASAATPKDESAWREFFRRLNERRNTLTLEWKGPLILCVPPFLEVAFAHEAPDFWSIRSTSTTLALPTPPVSQATPPPSRGGDESWFPDEPERLYAEVGTSRQRIEEAPDDPTALTSLAIRLRRLGRSHEEQRQWDPAREAYGNALELWRRVVEKNPESLEGLANLAGTLSDIGDVRMAEGDLVGARSAYEAAAETFNRLVERGPDNEELSSALAATFVRLGDIQNQQGDSLSAQASYEKALEHIHRSLELDPKRLEWLRNLSGVLERIGDAQAARGELATAESSYKESLEIMRRLVAVDPSRVQWLQDLAVILAKVGDARSAQGDIERAQRAYEESLSLTREILGRDPDRPESSHNFYVLLERMGNLEQARGDFPHAQASYEEAIGVLHGLLASGSGNPEWLKELALLLAKLGGLAMNTGQLKESLAAYLDAQKVFQLIESQFPEYYSAQIKGIAEVLADTIDKVKEAQRRGSKVESSPPP